MFRLANLELENIGPFTSLKLDTAPVVYFHGQPNTGKTWAAKAAIEIYKSLLGGEHKDSPQGFVSLPIVNWNSEETRASVSAEFVSETDGKWSTSVSWSHIGGSFIPKVSFLRIAGEEFALTADIDAGKIDMEGPRGGKKASLQIEDFRAYGHIDMRLTLETMMRYCYLSSYRRADDSAGSFGKYRSSVSSIGSLANYSFSYDHLRCGAFRYPPFMEPEAAHVGSWEYRLPHVLRSMDAEEFKTARNLIETYGREAGLFEKFRFRKYENTSTSPFVIEVKRRHGRKLGEWENIAASSERTTQGFIRAGVLAASGEDFLHIDRPDAAMGPAEKQAFAQTLAATADENRVVLLEASDYETVSACSEAMADAGVGYANYEFRRDRDNGSVVCERIGPGLVLQS